MINSQNDSPPKPALEAKPAASEYWPGRARLFILAGIAIEVAQLMAFPDGVLSPEGWPRIVGIGLIGIGLAIQFVGIPKARQVSVAQLGKTDKETAAEDRGTEEAKDEAPQAQSEIAPSRLSRSESIRAKADIISESLKPFPGTCFDGALAAVSGEQADLWWGLKAAFVAANWRQVTWTRTDNAIRYDSGPGPEAADAKNVEIHLHPQNREKLLPAATALILALNDAGIAAADVGFNCANGNVDAIHILIGDRR